MVLVDANVLIDMLVDDPTWRPWSEANVRRFAGEQGVGINPIIFAEVAPHFTSREYALRWLRGTPYARLRLPYKAAYGAGAAYARYRKLEKGEKRSPMPDFYIGAHAQLLGMQLLTRDPRRYRTYFPDVQLITPPSA